MSKILKIKHFEVYIMLNIIYKKIVSSVAEYLYLYSAYTSGGSVFIFLSIGLSICLTFFLSYYQPFSRYISLYTLSTLYSIYEYVTISLHHFYLSIYLLYLSICLYICLFICLSAYLSIYLSVSKYLQQTPVQDYYLIS